jgi:uncharacterized protein Yka (UPF0111/DUF47 family)
VGAIDAMGKEREEQILERVAEFTERVVVIVSKLQDVVQRFSAEEYSELAAAAQELDRLESEADTAKDLILDRLAMGGIFPMHTSDLARLVGSMDSIANLSAGAADRIVDMMAVERLRDSVLALERDLREAITIANSVDKIESRADDVFAEIYHLMFDMDTDFKTFHQLKAIIERLESIADRCSQNAELIRHMALEYLEAD